MSVDFNSLLSAPAGTALKPHVLPIGDYPAVVKNREFGESAQKKTPFVKYALGLTGWPEGLPDDQKGQTDDEGVFHPTDLTKKTVYVTYYLSEDAMFMLENAIASCGVELKGLTRKEAIEAVIGKYVIATVTQRVNETTSQPFTEVRGIVGQPGAN